MVGLQLLILSKGKHIIRWGRAVDRTAPPYDVEASLEHEPPVLEEYFNLKSTGAQSPITHSSHLVTLNKNFAEFI